MKFTLPKLLLSLAAFGSSLTAFADSNEQFDSEIKEFATFLGRLNRYSVLEGAQSHGTMGFSFGVGMTQESFPTQNKIALSKFERDEEDAIDESLSSGKLYLVKGLFWPLDIGATISSTNEANVSQVSGHLQFTMFEALALPAVALRSYYGRLIGLKNTEATSYGSDLMVSWGFLSFFSVYAGVGFQNSQFSFAYQDESKIIENYSLTNTSAARTDVEQQTYSGLAGIQVKFLPPFITATLESQFDDQQKMTSVAGKISVGM